MTVRDLIRKLKHPPCKRIAAVRIEFADGGIYEVSPERRISPSKPNPDTPIPGHKPAGEVRIGVRAEAGTDALKKLAPKISGSMTSTHMDGYGVNQMG